MVPRCLYTLMHVRHEQELFRTSYISPPILFQFTIIQLEVAITVSPLGVPLERKTMFNRVTHP